MPLAGHWVNIKIKKMYLCNMEFTASQIASLINGRIIGDENTAIYGVAPIERSEAGYLSFIAQEKFVPYLDHTPSAVLVVSEKFIDLNKSYRPTLIIVEDAYLSFQILLNMYQDMKEKKSGIEENVFIHDTATLGENIYIGAFTYISAKVKVGENTQIAPQVFIGNNVKIGKNCQIHSGVKIHEYCVIGDNCVIHSNTVIGSDGFGFQPSENGYTKIPQLGNVVIEEDVEIGSNCSIDRGTIGSTTIGKGTKMDNLIQIAHNVSIGQHNVIASQAGIAGSTLIGDWNMIGGQVGIVGHITIGNGVKIQAQSGVNTHVKDDETLYGSPAIKAGEYRRNYVHFKHLDALVKRIDELEKKLSQH